MKKIEGGITAAKGFQAAGGAAGIKKQGVKDMALVYSEVPCVAAGTFTTNIVKAAPVKWDQEIVYNHPTAQAIVCNSGIANAAPARRLWLLQKNRRGSIGCTFHSRGLRSRCIDRCYRKTDSDR